MKKTLISLIGGLVIGGITSIIFLDYKSSSYQIRNYYGIDIFKVGELDFDFLWNASVIVAMFSIFIFFSWRFIDKKFKKSKHIK